MKDYNFENGLPVGDKVKTFFLYNGKFMAVEK